MRLRKSSVGGLGVSWFGVYDYFHDHANDGDVVVDVDIDDRDDDVFVGGQLCTHRLSGDFYDYVGEYFYL